MSAVLIVLMLLYTGLCVYTAIKRRSHTAVIRVCTVAVCSVLAFIFALLLKNAAVDFLNVKCIPLIANYNYEYWDIANTALSIAPDFVILAEKVAVAAVVPLLYLLIFAVLRLLTWLIHLLICLLFKKVFFPQAWHRGPMGKFKRYVEGLKHRTSVSVVCGILQGSIVIFSVMIPITCYVEMADAMMDKIASSDLFTEEEAQETLGKENKVFRFVEQVDNSAVFTAFRKIGCSFFVNKLTLVTVNETLEVPLMNEIDSVAGLTVDVIWFVKYAHFEMTSILEDGKAIVSAIKDIMKNHDESQIIQSLFDNLMDATPDILGELAKRAFNAIKDWFIGLFK